jgi:hypothetical protein
MKKYILILILGIMSGCMTNRTMVRLSDIAVGEVKMEKVTKLYILNSGFGQSLYKVWESGVYGENIAILVDSNSFNTLYRNSTSIGNSNNFISSR